MLCPLRLVCRVWDLYGNTMKELRGREAAETLKSWQGATQQLIAKSSGGNGQVVEMLSRSAHHLLATVYITPPFQLTSTMMVVASTMRFTAFTRDNKFMCYELGLQA